MISIIQPTSGDQVAYEDGEGLLTDISNLGQDIQSGKSIGIIENDISNLTKDWNGMESDMHNSDWGFTAKQVDCFDSELYEEVGEIVNPINLPPNTDAATYWMSHAFSLGTMYYYCEQDDDNLNRLINE